MGTTVDFVTGRGPIGVHVMAAISVSRSEAAIITTVNGMVERVVGRPRASYINNTVERAAKTIKRKATTITTDTDTVLIIIRHTVVINTINSAKDVVGIGAVIDKPSVVEIVTNFDCNKEIEIISRTNGLVYANTDLLVAKGRCVTDGALTPTSYVEVISMASGSMAITIKNFNVVARPIVNNGMVGIVVRAVVLFEVIVGSTTTIVVKRTVVLSIRIKNGN